MEIVVKNSIDLTLNEWTEYTDSFNNVFEKEFTVDDFKHKYLNTIDGWSYHVLLKSEQIVVGGFTVIPYNYFLHSEDIRVGVVVDVFILSNFRSDLLALRKMYTAIKQDLKLKNIDVVITNPNDTAFIYWHKMIKMREIGNLGYYIFPKNISNIVLKLPSFINLLSRFAFYLNIWFSFFVRTREIHLPIRVNRSNSIIEIQRYTQMHKTIKIDKCFFSYSLIDEDNVRVCYLIDFYNNNGHKDSETLLRAIQFINRNEDFDLIIYIGKLNFFQSLLIKVPRKLEPRQLHFMGEVISDRIKEDFVYDFDNWDFGLFNFDVR